MKNFRKKQKGITLIALVITIVILIILATISINFVFNGGLIDRAEQARDYYQNDTEYTDDSISNLTGYIDGLINGIEGGSTSGTTLGAVYTDDMIGQAINYSANGQSDWIILGKDSDGNILITTKTPVADGFTLVGDVQHWLSYEEDLKTACSTYGATLQGDIEVKSRSITMDDINYVAGFTEPTWDTYTFGAIDNYEGKQVDYFYPSEEAASTGYWQDPKVKEGEFEFDVYAYGNNEGQYIYMGADTNMESVPASERNIRTDKLEYIIGPEDSRYMYVVGSRSVNIDSASAYFYVASVGGGSVRSGGNFYLCYSNASRGRDRGNSASVPVRPVAILPSNLQVEKQEDGTYLLAE